MGVRVTISFWLAGTPTSSSIIRPCLTGVLLITLMVSNSIPLPARQAKDSEGGEGEIWGLLVEAW